MANKLNYVIGDIFAYKANEDRAILHQCNTCGMMGAGIARVVSSKYPDAYEADLVFRHEIMEKFNLKEPKNSRFKATVPQMLGLFSTWEGKDGLQIVNLYGQNEPGYSPNFNNLLNALEDYLIENRNKANFLIPYKIGCGIAGGNWNELEKKLVKVLSSISDDKDILLIDKAFVVVLPEFANEIETK